MEDKVDGRDAKKVKVQGLLPTEAQKVQQKVNDDKAKQFVNERAKRNKRAAQLKLEERRKKDQEIQKEEKSRKERERIRKMEMKEMDEKNQKSF